MFFRRVRVGEGAFQFRIGVAGCGIAMLVEKHGRTSHDAAGGGELERRRRHGALLAQLSSSGGNTAENRVDARGSAIISATASRQAA